MAEQVTKLLEATTAPIAQRVAQGLRKIGLALKSRRWRQTGTFPLSTLQAEILSLLARMPGRTARVSDVAEALAVQSPTISEAVNTLILKGLVRKTRRADDGRARDVTLTAKGRRQARRAADWPSFLTQAAAQLSSAEQEALLTLVMKLIRLLQTGGEIPVAQMCVTCHYFQPHAHDDPARPHHCAFVNEPFGPRLLRIDCPEHAPAPSPVAARNWRVFLGGKT